MSAWAVAGLVALGVLTALWARAAWRVFVWSDHRCDDFDASLARRFRMWVAGIALTATWLGLLLPLLRR